MTDARRLAKDAPSMRLHDLIDWAEIAHKLKGPYKRELTRGGGPQPYEPLSMFKLMLLGQWHNLSAPQLEIVDSLVAEVAKPVAVLADKGYASQANRDHLAEHGIVDLIQHKGMRGHPAHPLRRKFNSAIATLHYEVEQAFGTTKRRFHLARARYFGVAKTQAQMAWAALGMNLLKAHGLLQSGRLQPLAGSSPC